MTRERGRGWAERMTVKVKQMGEVGACLGLGICRGGKGKLDKPSTAAVKKGTTDDCFVVVATGSVIYLHSIRGATLTRPLDLIATDPIPSAQYLILRP
ncbi:hypothetical protein AG1IA_06074 [Rhizoctonia solani AG-1 IA]|uniref:Uncharacterized protein n=1 Tax=Thanatephorus cucumeris (strain AG1-IA) TaxID=983506 RepID=L8WPJ1_THACA|nr:hypothetical protein AG1IA_06074 [Rhizoctonia solani AG-1 IA]